MARIENAQISHVSFQNRKVPEVSIIDFDQATASAHKPRVFNTTKTTPNNVL